MLDQDNNFYLISLSILNIGLLNNVQMLQEEVTGWSFLEVNGLRLVYKNNPLKQEFSLSYWHSNSFGHASETKSS